MFAIRVELLGGVYRASSFEDRRRPEWPPHPARLFYAAVAVVHDHDPPLTAELDALRWWEGLGAPEVHASSSFDRDHRGAGRDEWRIRAIVDHYVPGNYASSWSRDIQGQWQDIADLENAVAEARDAAASGDVASTARALERARRGLIEATRRVGSATGTESDAQVATASELLPDNRNRQPRQFPAVVPDSALVYFSWPGVLAPEEHVAALDAVLGRIARLGHSASTVTCCVVKSAPPATLVPTDYGTEELRTVAPGVLAALERDFARHEGASARVLPALITSYGAVTRRRARVRRPTNSGDWIVLTLPPGAKLPAPRSLDLAVAVRGALLRHAADPSPPFISGHGPGLAPTPPTTEPHVAAVPLVNIAHRHADGAIHGLALVLPPETSAHDRAALSAALAAWQSAGDGVFPVTLPGGLLRQFAGARLSAENRSARAADIAVTEREYWSRVSPEWASVTPMALDRYPRATPRRPGAYAEQTAALVASACRTVGLPEPVDVSCSPASLWAAAPAVVGRTRDGAPVQRRGFPAYRTRSGGVRHTTHVQIRFPEPVGGPIVLGAGRFFGYGLLYPVLPGGRGEA